jgi:protein O-mannosyl-transferase
MIRKPARAIFASGWPLLIAGLLVAALALCPGVPGGWLFDDYPNIVDNQGVQPGGHDLGSLTNAALSSPSSELKRPLSSLSFALNYLASGHLDAPAMRATNVVIHLINGFLTFLLLRRLVESIRPTTRNAGQFAALIATMWMLLPINLTGVLYIVQRMESLANLFVRAGLIGYVSGRARMLAGKAGLGLACGSVLVFTGLGAMAKETAIMLPLYALVLELFIFRWQRVNPSDAPPNRDRRLIAFYVVVLVLPLIAGSAWLIPTLFNPATWARRDFTLATRLLSEARVVIDYVGWTFVPTPSALSFYHDDFQVSQGLFHPWTTAVCIVAIVALGCLSWALRKRYALASVGIAWYLGCHLLTGTVLPLELVYEHRNYFASLGLLLAALELAGSIVTERRIQPAMAGVLLIAYMAWLGGLTWLTARSWGDPLAQATELAYRAPMSPRAQYELGRTYIIYSHYDPASPFTPKVYPVLERAAALPGASILPEQALIFMNSRMRRPIEPTWWASMVRKLRASAPTVQDESSLGALADCLKEGSCVFPPQDLLNAFLAALQHPAPTSRLLAMYSGFAWNNLGDRKLALDLQRQAVRQTPGESAYRYSLARMATVAGNFADAHDQIDALERMNTGGRLNRELSVLRADLASAEKKAASGTSPE